MTCGEQPVFDKEINGLDDFFFCVGVVYSGEYDVCDVTLSVYPHQASLKNMPGHGGLDESYKLMPIQ